MQQYFSWLDRLWNHDDPSGNEEGRFYSNSGSRFRPFYKMVDDELVEDGLDNIYERIQSFADSVDINKIVQRYAAGDTYALEQRLASYVDVTGVPDDLRGLMEAGNELRRIYSENEVFQNTYGSFQAFLDDADFSRLKPSAHQGVDEAIPKIFNEGNEKTEVGDVSESK